jgi:DNA-binding HxlR family transcriptional regulator
VQQSKHGVLWQAVASRRYGQYCGLARALELVGERWALLIVRDLLVGPRRFTDLRRGLPRIPTNVLSDRLRELEQDGIVRRRVLPRPAAAVVYELTDYGCQLEDAVMRLGLWGAQALGDPAPDEIMTSDSMTIALRSTFVPRAARGRRVSYELRLGPLVLHAHIDGERLTVGEEALADADLVIEAGPAIKDLLSGEIDPEQAVDRGLVRLEGDPALLRTFVELFHIPSRSAATLRS